MPATVLHAERLFDGEGALADAAIVIEDGRVRWAGRRARLPRLGSGARESQAPKGTTVVPGFVDCHVHLSARGLADFDKDIQGTDADFALRAYANASRALRAGVCTQRDLGSPTYAVIALARAVAERQVVGPNIVACGKGITTTGGHGWQIGRIADGADEVRKAAREQLSAGAKVIKIFSTGGVLGAGAHPDVAQFTEEETRAAVEEAHKAHLKITTHAHATAGIRVAIAAGVDSIEHATLLDRETIRMCKERGTALVPTFSALRAILSHADALDPAVLERGRALVESHREGLRSAYRAGVLIATGTDAGTPFNYAHEYAHELEALVDIGLTPEAAMRAGTSVAADVIGLADVGRIRAGARADLVALRGDPLADVSAAWRVAAVWKDGEPVRE